MGKLRNLSTVVPTSIYWKFNGAALARDVWSIVWIFTAYYELKLNQQWNTNQIGQENRIIRSIRYVKWKIEKSHYSNWKSRILIDAESRLMKTKKDNWWRKYMDCERGMAKNVLWERQWIDFGIWWCMHGHTDRQT